MFVVFNANQTNIANLWKPQHLNNYLIGPLYEGILHQVPNIYGWRNLIYKTDKKYLLEQLRKQHSEIFVHATNIDNNKKCDTISVPKILLE